MFSAKLDFFPREDFPRSDHFPPHDVHFRRGIIDARKNVTLETLTCGAKSEQKIIMLH